MYKYLTQGRDILIHITLRKCKNEIIIILTNKILCKIFFVKLNIYDIISSAENKLTQLLFINDAKIDALKINITIL